MTDVKELKKLEVLPLLRAAVFSGETISARFLVILYKNSTLFLGL